MIYFVTYLLTYLRAYFFFLFFIFRYFFTSFIDIVLHCFVYRMQPCPSSDDFVLLTLVEITRDIHPSRLLSSTSPSLSSLQV